MIACRLVVSLQLPALLALKDAASDKGVPPATSAEHTAAAPTGDVVSAAVGTGLADGIGRMMSLTCHSRAAP